jgi:hypothetical protein
MPAATTIARIDHEASRWDQAFFPLIETRVERH